MVSIVDALGAITNITKIITVTPQSMMSSAASADLSWYGSVLLNVLSTNNVSLTIEEELKL